MRRVSAVILLSCIAALSSAQWLTKVLHPTGAVRSEGLALMDGKALGYVAGFAGIPSNNASYWDVTTGAMTSLGNQSSMILAGKNGILGGYSRFAGSSTNHATLWDLASGTRTDLNPASAGSSQVLGMSSVSQVGVINGAGSPHAALWNGSAASFVDLNPVGSPFSKALGATDSYQFGYARVDGWDRAMLWSGTAASATLLGPTGPGDPESYAYCGVGGRQAGIVGTHAAMWNGTPESLVDFNPSHLNSQISTIFGMTSDVQVGSCGPNFNEEHACLWNGTPESAMDLHQFLPPGYRISVALAIDPTNRIIVGNALKVAGGSEYEAVVWYQPVPEPTMIVIGIPAALVALRKKKSRKRP